MCRAWAITRLIPPNKQNFHLEMVANTTPLLASVTLYVLHIVFCRGLYTTHLIPPNKLNFHLEMVANTISLLGVTFNTAPCTDDSAYHTNPPCDGFETYYTVTTGAKVCIVIPYVYPLCMGGCDILPISYHLH
jgi:hypothetical protein